MPILSFLGGSRLNNLSSALYHSWSNVTSSSSRLCCLLLVPPYWALRPGPQILFQHLGLLYNRTPLSCLLRLWALCSKSPIAMLWLPMELPPLLIIFPSVYCWQSWTQMLLLLSQHFFGGKETEEHKTLSRVDRIFKFITNLCHSIVLYFYQGKTNHEEYMIILGQIQCIFKLLWMNKPF